MLETHTHYANIKRNKIQQQQARGKTQKKTRKCWGSCWKKKKKRVEKGEEIKN